MGDLLGHPLIDADCVGDLPPARDDIADLREDRLSTAARQARHSGDRAQVGDSEAITLAVVV